MDKDVVVTEFEQCSVHSDAGDFGMTFNCPDCSEQLVYAPGGWWDMNCSCRYWSVSIKAYGRKIEGNK